MSEQSLGSDPSDDLRHYLQQSRETLVINLEGLSDYDIRRPMTPSGTNLLGLVKHVVGVELGYLGACVGRPAPFSLPWFDDGSVWDGADMWATASESREYIVDLYHQTWRHSDESLATLPLHTPAMVPWWSENRRTTTIGHLTARVVAETAHHAGHSDIIRESIDGRGGADQNEVGDSVYWSGYVAQLQSIADTFRDT
jgi:hypothetical protein